MRKLLGLIVLMGLVGPATAQFDINQHDGTTDYTSRSTAPGGQDGWAINKYSFDQCGSGFTGINGYSSVMQDQNCGTLENWQFGIFDQLLADANGPIPNGDPRSVPDVNAPLSATAIFPSPGCPGSTNPGPAAWIFSVTLTTPLLYQVNFTNDLFTATFLPSNSAWVSDGSSSHISIVGQGGSQEFPIISQDPATQTEIGQTYGFAMLGGPGLAIGQGTENYSSNPRIFLNRIRYEHQTRAGAFDTTGTVFASIPAVNPDNYGFAGTYPDGINVSALAARADDLTYIGENANFFGASVIGTIALGGSLARTTFAAPLPFGNGWLEIDPLDPLFTLTLAGGIPGLQVPGIIANQQSYMPSPGIQGTVAVDLHVFQANLYAQELRIDLGTGQLEVGSLDSSQFRL